MINFFYQTFFQNEEVTYKKKLTAVSLIFAMNLLTAIMVYVLVQ